jgi:hypothetical protein
MSNAVIYDIDVFSDGLFIDQFMEASNPQPEFDDAKWIETYKRHFPRIAARYPNITIKVTKREETK